MNKINFEKPKKEAKKHAKESISLVDELKIDKEKEEDVLEEEVEAKFWGDLYKEKLEEIKEDKDFKEAVLNDLDEKIKAGKVDYWSYDGAKKVIWRIFCLKNIGLYKKEYKDRLQEYKDNISFKQGVIN